ncbi:MAG: polymer-forming cytoskeletal protein, partial [Gammaproteobacteria bacterium]|nr:polymer-forming cytoskeletal protein [Gammaproteobacteria bacterium]
RVEGGISMRRHDVTVGRKGRVVADIRGKRICVEGQVKGDLFGEEVVIRGSGRVEGNASAAQVTLEQGCHFRGSINMESETEGSSKKASPGPRPVASGAA